MRISSVSFSAPIATILLFLAGCYYPPERGPVYGQGTQPAYAPVADVPTSLVIVVEGEITEDAYRTRRLEIVNYLIERGYIVRESDLIGDPASATRIIRAIVNQDGFTLSVFNQNPTATEIPDLETTDILYPDDPYFIFGFEYMYEIGPRRLPPRPRDYHPHPRPPHSGPPSDHRNYDHDRHWSRPGRPDSDDRNRDGPGGQHRQDGARPRPDTDGQPSSSHRPAPGPDHPPYSENNRQPQGPADTPRPLPPQPGPDRKQDDRVVPPHQGDRAAPAPRPRLKPPVGPERQTDAPATPPGNGADLPRPDNGGRGQPAPNPNSPPPHNQDRTSRGNTPAPNHPPAPPPPRTAPAPEHTTPPPEHTPSPAPEAKDRQEDKDRRDQQR